MPLNIFRRYLSLADSNPIVFNVVNSSTLFGIGDCIQQNMDVNRALLGNPSKNTALGNYNYFQTFKLMAYGALFAPFTHLFYTKVLPKIIPLNEHPSVFQLGKKCIVDYTLYSPL